MITAAECRMNINRQLAARRQAGRRFMVSDVDMVPTENGRSVIVYVELGRDDFVYAGFDLPGFTPPGEFPDLHYWRRFVTLLPEWLRERIAA